MDDPDQIVALTRTSNRGYDVDPSPFDYLTWSRVQRRYTGLGAFEEQSMNLGGDNRRARHDLWHARCSNGVSPSCGRAHACGDCRYAPGDCGGGARAARALRSRARAGRRAPARVERQRVARLATRGGKGDATVHASAITAIDILRPGMRTGSFAP